MAKSTKTKKSRKAAAAPAKSGRKDAGKGKAKAGGKGKGSKQEKGLGARARKVQSSKQSRGATSERKGAMKFLREVKVELSKVTWPNREELTQSTIVVFIAIAIAALYIAFFDEAFTRLVELIS